METLYFIAVGIVLYFLADRILDRIETRRGARFENRSLYFFAILLGLALATFAVIQRLTGAG